MQPTTSAAPDPLSINLSSGGHHSRASGTCLLEAVAWVAGEPHSDRPACACPVLAAYGRALNDNLDDANRQRLRPLIPRLVGSVSTPEVEVRRTFALVDSSIRVRWPLVLESIALAFDAAKLDGDGADLGDKFRAHAATFRALPELTFNPDPSAPAPTFKVMQEKELPDGALFARCGYEQYGREQAEEYARDLSAGKYRSLYWRADPADDDEWVVQMIPAARAALAARADLADLADLAARAALAPTVSEQVNAKRKEIIDETIAVFERAIAISNSPAEEVSGSAATDEVGRAPLTRADQDDAGDGADPVALGRALADLHAERASIDDEPAEGESSGADVGGEG